MYKRTAAYDHENKQWFSFYENKKGQIKIDNITKSKKDLLLELNYKNIPYETTLKKDRRFTSIKTYANKQKEIDKKIKKIKSENDLLYIKKLSRETPGEYRTADIKKLEEKIITSGKKHKEYFKFNSEIVLSTQYGAGYKAIFEMPRISEFEKIENKLSTVIKDLKETPPGTKKYKQLKKYREKLENKLPNAKKIPVYDELVNYTKKLHKKDKCNLYEISFDIPYINEENEESEIKFKTILSKEIIYDYQKFTNEIKESFKRQDEEINFAKVKTKIKIKGVL